MGVAEGGVPHLPRRRPSGRGGFRTWWAVGGLSVVVELVVVDLDGVLAMMSWKSEHESTW